MAYNPIDASFAIKENNSLSDNEKLNYLQNQRQLDEQRQQRLYEKQQQNQWRNQGIIGDDLNFDKYKTGEQAIDEYSQSELGKIQKEALINHINDDPAQLEYWLTQRLAPLSQWHTQALGAYKNLTESMQDFNKTYTGSDFGAVKKIGYQQLQKDLLDVDENGNVTRKNTEDIHPTDYNALFQSAPVLAATSNDPSAFNKFFEEYPKDNIHDTKYVNKKGNIVQYGYSGIMPRGIGEFVTDEDNRPVAVRLQGKQLPAVQDASGKPAVGLLDDLYDAMTKIPTVKQASLGMWRNSPEYARAQQSYLASTGRPMPQDAEKQLMSKFLYDKAAPLINHNLSVDDKQTTPKITINAGGGNGANETTINDITPEINSILSDKQIHPLTSMPSDAREYFTKSVNSGRAGKELNPDNLSVIIGNDGSYRVLNMKKNGEVVGVFNPKDVKLKTNTGQKNKNYINANGQIQQPQTNEFDQYTKENN